MVHMEPWLGMVKTPYCFDESKPSDEKNDFHVNGIVDKNEQVEPINQTIRPLVLEFKYVSGSAHIINFNWALSHRNLCLNTELKVRQMF